VCNVKTLTLRMRRGIVAVISGVIAAALYAAIVKVRSEGALSEHRLEILFVAFGFAFLGWRRSSRKTP
jgi:hypothetical protein